MSAADAFEDVSSPEGLNGGAYEVHTSSALPNDFRGGIVILCYNHDMQCRYRLLWIKVQNDTNIQTFSCEFLRNSALRLCCNITPFAANLFHLYDETRKRLVPLGRLVSTASSSNNPAMFFLRMIWKPKDMMELHKVDPAALRYLYYQCHDDFVYGDIIEKVSVAQKTYESLLGLVIFDMVAFALNSEPKIRLRDLKRNYKADQFMNQKVLTSIEPNHRFRSLYQIFNTFRINLICRQNLDEHYRDFSSQVTNGDASKVEDGALNVMLSYIKAISDKVVGYFTVSGQLLDEKKKVVIYHPQNEVFIQNIDGSKEKLFEISRLQRPNGISVSFAVSTDSIEEKPCRLSLFITKPENDWEKIELEFACADEAYHFAAALISLYQSTVYYPCSDLTDNEILAPPSIVKLKSTGFHGSISEFTALKLMNTASNRVGNFLLHQSSNNWQKFFLDVWHQQSNEPFLLRHSILLSEKAFQVTECMNMKTSEVISSEMIAFPSMPLLISHFRSAGLIKEVISPSSKYRAGFPVGMEDRKEPAAAVENSKCSQAHIIPSSELEISKRSESKLGEGINTVVVKAAWRQKQIAVKMVKESPNRFEMERLLQLSGSNFLRLKSSFVTEVYGFSVDGITQYMLMEYCHLGNLSEFLTKRKFLRKLKKKHLLSAQRQIIKGLEFLHMNNSFHGNLRCGNVLISKFNDQLIVKLADPGLAGGTRDGCLKSLSLSHKAKARLDVKLFAKTVIEMYSIWTADALLIHDVPSRPMHCPEELFFTVLMKCLDTEGHPDITTTDIMKDLIVFEQGFNGGELFLLTESYEENTDHLEHFPESTMVIERQFIQFDEKSKSSKLGQGHYGQVFRGTYKGDPCAIKKLLLWCSDNIEKDNELEKEFEIMSKLDHGSIVKLFGRCRPIRDTDQSEPYLLVMEYLAGGCLLNYLRDNSWKSNYNPDFCISWALQIAQGLEYLHSQSIVHRDLACRNILLTKDHGSIKISDFGLSRLLDEKNYYKCSNRELPIYWLAPESFPIRQNPQCGKPSDVWSYGVVLWEIFNFGAKPQSAEPYRDLELPALFHMFRATSQRLQMPSDCPQLISGLVTDCWKFAPSERPPACDFVQRLSSCS